MDIESLFSESKWRILSELSHQSLSPSELAKKTGTSMANISTQVRLLEALGFIEKKKLTNRARGDPRKRYFLKKEFCYMVLATKTTIGKKMFRPDDESLFFFKVFMILDNSAPQVLIKLFCEHDDIFRKVDSLGYLGIRGNELEIVVLHDNPEILHFLHEKQIRWNNDIYKVKAHIHKKDDFKNGFNSKEEYFMSIVKKVFILIDEDVLTRLKKS